jgi:hypothetical protein
MNGAEVLAAFLVLALVLRWCARNPSPGVTALRTAEQLRKLETTEEACHGMAGMGSRLRRCHGRLGGARRALAPAGPADAEEDPGQLAADVAAVADAVRADPSLAWAPAVAAPLTPLDEVLLDTVAVCMPAYHHAAVDRGRQLADLFRGRAPDSTDAELSRGVLHMTHVLEWAGQQLGDPGFYGHCAIEFAICAYELTEIERA